MNILRILNMQFPESTIVIIDPEEKPVLWVEIDEWGEIDRMESCRIEEELEADLANIAIS